MTEKDDRRIIRHMVRQLYDIQNERIMAGNQIIAYYKLKLGIKPGEKEDKSAGKKILDGLKQDYKRLSDAVEKMTIKNFESTGNIETYPELILIKTYQNIVRMELENTNVIHKIIDNYTIYTEYLSKIDGVGPISAAILISEIDITRVRYASSLWRYAMLDTVTIEVEPGVFVVEGRGRKKEHLVDYEYIDKDGNPATKKGLSGNPFLKTKLLSVIVPSFLKRKNDNKYAKIYYDYLHRLETHPIHSEKTKMHRRNMTLRYTAKEFLADLYLAWRPIEGLPLAKRYSEEKLDIEHLNPASPGKVIKKMPDSRSTKKVVKEIPGVKPANKKGRKPKVKTDGHSTAEQSNPVNMRVSRSRIRKRK